MLEIRNKDLRDECFIGRVVVAFGSGGRGQCAGAAAGALRRARARRRPGRGAGDAARAHTHAQRPAQVRSRMHNACTSAAERC